MSEYDIYQVDAFAGAVFAGNPAAVVPMADWAPDAVLQNIASENNLAETAFFTATDAPERYRLRWFTPAQEVPLCGHATLASAHVLFKHLGFTGPEIVFETLGGDLTVKKSASGGYEMDFPADPPTPTVAPEGLADALGAAPSAVFRAQYLMAVYPDAAAVKALRPDLTKLEALADGRLTDCVIATAPGEGDADFVSRFFAPSQGIPEDPVTGSAHCVLAPYWADKLGKRQLVGFQASKRGGRVACRLAGDRVMLSGDAVTYLRGRIFV